MEREKLLRSLGSYFESYAHNLPTNEEGHVVFSFENWQTIRRSLNTTVFPEDSRSYYDFVPFFEERKSNLPKPDPEYEEGITEKVLENVEEIVLRFLYPRTTIALTQQKILPYSKDSLVLNFLVENFSKFQTTLSTKALGCVRAWINFYYGQLPISQREAIASAAKHISTMVYSTMKSHWVYSDQDEIFFWRMPSASVEHLKQYVEHLGYSFEHKMWKSAIFFGKRKYVLINDDKTKIRGFKRATFY